MEPFSLTIGAFLLVAAALFVTVEAWRLASTTLVERPGQEETESHWHFDDGADIGSHTAA
jgi:hypothetical protein